MTRYYWRNNVAEVAGSILKLSANLFAIVRNLGRDPGLGPVAAYRYYPE
jgi:hypothetical protein